MLIQACSGPQVKFDESGGTAPIDEQIHLIKEHVTDPERRDKCLAVAGDRIITIVQKGRNLNLNYTSTEVDFKLIIAELMTERKKVQGTIMNLHFQLRDKITEEQWQIIFGKKTENNSE